MKKRFVYFLIGALLTGLVLVVFQISRAEVVAPNPGHTLSCTSVYCTSIEGKCGVTCPTGTVTGCSIYAVQLFPTLGFEVRKEANGCWCNVMSATSIKCHAMCCEAI